MFREFIEQLAPVNDSFKIIVLDYKTFMNKFDMAILNWLAKMQINFKDFLDINQKD